MKIYKGLNILVKRKIRFIVILYCTLINRYSLDLGTYQFNDQL